MATARPVVSWIRWTSGAEILLLVAQFELGEWLTIFGDFPADRMRGMSLPAFVYNVVATGPALVVHAALGLTILAIAAVSFLLSFFVRIRWLRLVTGLGLTFAASAATGGFLFVVQGFAGDRSLFLMGSSFIALFVATSLSLYLVLTIARVPAPDPSIPAR